MAILRIQTGPKKGALIHIQEPSLTLGRGEKIGLQVPDQGASRRHAEIFRIGELHFIRDLASRNGTFVNDRKITEVVLREGDQIRVGDTFMVFLESENFSTARALRLHDGSPTMESVRFRDTLSGFEPTGPGLEAEDLKKNLPRQLAQRIAAGEGPRGVFNEMLRELGTALGSDRADLLLVDALEPEIRFHPIATFDTKGEGEVAISRTILREVLGSKQAILSSDAASDLRFSEVESIVSLSIRSVICVPLIIGAVPAGVLYLSNTQRPDAFDRDGLELATQIGLQISAVLGMLHHFQAREGVIREALKLAVNAARRGKEGDSSSTRVAEYCQAIAACLGLPVEDIQGAWVAGMLHRLENLESAGPETEKALEAIHHQDERHDGSGSPGGKKGDEIPVLGRILALAKELDRQVAPQGAESLLQVLEKIRGAAGKEFHPDVVQACLVAHRQGMLENPEKIVAATIF
ncbi:MAG: FHA domain-containing protein [Planctomycetes bacterium]|nr:FHA domain-containing protein [Planctomycetota bacterium]